MTDIPYPAAPKGLVLDDCTVSGDGGRTRPTLADFVADLSGLGGRVASAVQAAAEAIQKAQEAYVKALDAAKAADTAQSSANGAVAKTDVALPEFDQVAGMKKGVLAAASASYSGALLGQGAQVSWNDPPGSAGTSFTNISPPGTTGGHKFFNVYSGTTALDSARWGFRLYTDWGFSHLGLPGSTACQWTGRPDNGNWQFLNFFCAAKSFLSGGDLTSSNSADVALVAHGGSGNASDGTLDIRAGVIGPGTNAFTDLGTDGVRFKNLYLSGAVNAASDIKTKDVVNDLLAPDFTDRDKLLAFYDALHPKLYRLKNEVATSADKAKQHVGVIAQDVEAALIEAGLDPEKYAFWGKYFPSENVQVPDGEPEKYEVTDPVTGEKRTVTMPVRKFRYENRPVLDAGGKQVEMQQVAYTGLQMLICVCERLKREAVEKKLSGLETRPAALEAAQHGS